MARTAAFVMARGGSKGVPGKNVRLLAGKPLIAYTLEAAVKSRALDRLILSTDSPEIAEIGRLYGAETPFLRPAELAADASPGFDALLHCAQWLAEVQKYEPENILELLPTSPLRTAEDITAAIGLMEPAEVDSVVSVTPATQHPCWMKKIDKAGRLLPYLDTPFATTRRQDLPAAFALHGAIKIARREVLVTRRTWYTDRTMAYVMPAERSLDIDTLWDFHLCELVIHDRIRKESPTSL